MAQPKTPKKRVIQHRTANGTAFNVSIQRYDAGKKAYKQLKRTLKNYCDLTSHLEDYT